MEALKKIVTAVIVLMYGCASAPVITIRPEPQMNAWWLRLDVHPTNTVIRGIPIQQIEPTWMAAYEFNKEDFPREVLYPNQVDLLEENNVTFSLTGDFNHDGVQDIAIVGVYKNTAGEQGSFLLILTIAENGDWQVSFLDTSHDGGGFMAIDQNSSHGIGVWFCLYCDHGVLYKWDDETSRYERQRPMGQYY